MVTSRFPSNLGVGSRFKKRNHMVYHDFASKVAIAHLEPYPNNPNHQNYGCCVCTITDMIYIYIYIHIYIYISSSLWISSFSDGFLAMPRPGLCLPQSRHQRRGGHFHAGGDLGILGRCRISEFGCHIFHWKQMDGLFLSVEGGCEIYIQLLQEMDLMCVYIYIHIS